MEQGLSRRVLVKLRLCAKCSKKLLACGQAGVTALADECIQRTAADEAAPPAAAGPAGQDHDRGSSKDDDNTKPKRRHSPRR